MGYRKRTVGASLANGGAGAARGREGTQNAFEFGTPAGENEKPPQRLKIVAVTPRTDIHLRLTRREYDWIVHAVRFSILRKMDRDASPEWKRRMQNILRDVEDEDSETWKIVAQGNKNIEQEARRLMQVLLVLKPDDPYTRECAEKADDAIGPLNSPESEEAPV